ncbi:MAG: hypothetical protein LRY39_00965 [Alphaproteobacteria bacterium]|nr:hypothetical protein [Alphaproteobacteria bacterium]
MKHCIFLTAAGIDFYVRYNDETPLEIVLQQHRYSHLHVMLDRDGEKLANYCDESGNAAAVMAIALKDRQAFRMLYLEGLDYKHVDAKGWALVHHAFEHSFLPGVYAWRDEGLSIDTPVQGTEYTGLSLARYKQDQAMIDFALKSGANAAAPVFAAASTAPEPVTGNKVEDSTTNAPVASPANEQLEFSADLLNSPATNQQIEAAARSYVDQGGSLNITDLQNVSLLELCWRNRKPDPALDRRALLPVLGKLGGDPSASLPDGTTVLTRITAASTLDMDFLKAIAPFARDVNSPDAEGNNLLHILQMNASEAVGHSRHVVAVLQLFPALDINRQNNDGFSNVGLAIRLNRSQTLKNLPSAVGPRVDLGQVTAAGWSLLDIAFTQAAGQQDVAGAQRAGRIAVSDHVRTAVLDLAGRVAVTGNAAQKSSLSEAFHRTRPDGKTLLEAASADHVSAASLNRLQTLEQTLS